MNYKHILFFLGVIYSQESVTLADYQRAENFLSTNTRSLVYRANVNPNTNLTQTQEALLSPEEKVIASRRV